MIQNETFIFMHKNIEIDFIEFNDSGNLTTFIYVIFRMNCMIRINEILQESTTKTKNSINRIYK